MCAVCHPAQPEKDTNNHVLLVPAGRTENEWAAMFGLIVQTMKSQANRLEQQFVLVV